MNKLESLAKFLEAVSKLVGVLAWPAVCIFVLMRFAPAISNFISSLGEFSLKGGGFEFSGRREEAASALAAASVSRSVMEAEQGDEAEPAGEAGNGRNLGSSEKNTAADVKSAVRTVGDLVTPSLIRSVQRSIVLWVDDKPSNNVNERRSLEALDISFVLAKSTDEAMVDVNRQSFDLIISDMGRPGDTRAGLTLLKSLRSLGVQTPYIIYAGARASIWAAEAKDLGALGCVNRPDQLFQLAVRALERSSEA